MEHFMPQITDADYIVNRKIPLTEKHYCTVGQSVRGAFCTLAYDSAFEARSAAIFLRAQVRSA